MREQLERNTDKKFCNGEDKVVLRQCKEVKFISYEDFCFDRTESNWDSCAKNLQDLSNL